MGKPPLGNWDSCYTDIQNNQNSCKKSNQSQGIGVSVDPRLVPGYQKQKKQKTKQKNTSANITIL